MTDQPDTQKRSSEPPGVLEELAGFGRWCRANTAQAALLAGLVLTLVAFYFFYKPLNHGYQSFANWASEAFGEENDLEHGPLILPGAILVAWLQRAHFARARKEPSNLGVLWLGAGVFLFVVAVWTVQPRLALVALPLLILGSVHFAWGWQVAKHAILPCLLLLFMVPIGFLLSHTEPLQRLVATVVGVMTNLVGIGVIRDGVKLMAMDGSFQCEVAGGCSGVRSIMAMTMLSLLFVHFNEKQLWKKVLVFGMTLPFTVIGNIFRVFSIVLVSKFFGEKWGTGPWHDISGFLVGIPISVVAMIKFSDLLNSDWSGVKEKLLARDEAPAAKEGSDKDEPAPANSPAPKPAGGPISYDY